MGPALAVAAGGLLLICCGAWALQIGVALVRLAGQLLVWVATLTCGLIALAVLAVVDRRELRRLWRNPPAGGVSPARARWS